MRFVTSAQLVFAIISRPVPSKVDDSAGEGIWRIDLGRNVPIPFTQRR